MNHVDLQRKLIAAARAHPPSDRVPFAFKHRVMALLQARPLPDPRALWASALWRGALACLALMFLLGTAAVVVPPNRSTPGDLSQAFESTMLVTVAQDSDFSW